MFAGSGRLTRVSVATQALVQFPEPVSASNAKQALEGHAIYDGGYNRVRSAHSHLLYQCKRIPMSNGCGVAASEKGDHAAAEDRVLRASGPECESK